MTVLDSEMAARSGVVTIRERELLAPSGSVTSREGIAESVELAGRSHESRRVAVQDLAGFQAPGGRQQNGLIGSDFFLEYTVIFDMDKSRFALSEEPAPTRAGLRPHTMRLEGGTPLIEIFFEGESAPRWVRLDTGSGYFSERWVYLDVSRPMAEQLLGDAINEPPVSTAVVASIAGEEILDIHEYGPVRMLGKTFPTVRLVVRNRGGMFEDEAVKLVSGSLLRQFSRIEVDYPRRLVWVSE